MNRSTRVKIILERLPKMYPGAKCLLEYHGDPGKLLVSTILSARTTDEAVNRVTPELWRRFGDPAGLAAAEISAIEEVIHPLGFFRNKARSIREAARRIVEKGGVPDNMEELILIRGVGRKTANVILGEIFGKGVIIVDTHVGRLARRLDLSGSSRPEAIERDLENLIPPDKRTAFSHESGFHGRRVCHSRRPDCANCGLSDVCPRIGVT